MRKLIFGINVTMVAGKGRRLFDHVDFQKKFQFKLAESRVFAAGHMALHYLKS